RIMFRFSPEDYRQMAQVWNGPHPEDGTELVVEDAIPTGAPPPDLPEQPQLTAPGLEPGLVEEMAKRLFGSARWSRRGAARPRRRRESDSGPALDRVTAASSAGPHLRHGEVRETCSRTQNPLHRPCNGPKIGDHGFKSGGITCQKT